jgi:hypothetical protein
VATSIYILHNMLDRREDITALTRAELAEFARTLDLRRANNFSDVEYQTWIQERITQILTEGAERGFESGAQTASHLLTPSREAPEVISTPSESTFLATRTETFRATVQDDVISFGMDLNAIFNRELASGDDIDTITERLIRGFAGDQHTPLDDLISRANQHTAGAVREGERSGMVEETVRQENPESTPDDVVTMAGEQVVIWMTVEDGHHICPDCVDLHGEKMTYETFMSIKGTTICDGWCRCFPSPVTDESIEGPLIRPTPGQAILRERIDMQQANSEEEVPF